MIKLNQTAKAMGSEELSTIAKQEIEGLDPALLPLQQGLSHSSYVGSSAFKAVILNISEADTINIKTGIFYSGIIAGCNCSDDPSPTDEQTEYCELQFNIDKNTAEASVKLLTD